MPYPRFLAEMNEEPRRRGLVFGVITGYGLAAAFAALAVAGWALGLVTALPQMVLLVAAKLATNTLAALSLRARRFELEFGGLNVFMDIVTMTGAIYFTGGVHSPLVATYVIEIAVVSVLTNFGITALVSLGAFVLYTAMAILTHTRRLPQFTPPMREVVAPSLGYVAILIAWVGALLAITTTVVSAFMRQTRRKEIELEAKARELADAGKARSQFMANVTHELRTPIHGIVGLTDLLDEGLYGPVSDKQREAYNKINASAQTLLQLIDDLLELARSDAGRLEFRPARVDLRECIETTVAQVHYIVGNKPLDLELDLANELPAIRTDRAKLVQILINLLSNAIKFTPDGGRVRVHAEAREEAAAPRRKTVFSRGKSAPERARVVAISVTDTGIGIAETDLASLFRPFHQLDGSASRRYGGTGLGLALVAKLLDVIGGSIEVESVPGEGSTFTVILPIDETQPTLARSRRVTLPGTVRGRS